MKCKLTKIRSTHSNLRTDEILGETLCLPVAGMCFVLDSDALSPIPVDMPEGSYYLRRIMTTPVQSVERMENEYLFVTENSTYKLELLDETTAAVL